MRRVSTFWEMEKMDDLEFGGGLGYELGIERLLARPNRQETKLWKDLMSLGLENGGERERPNVCISNPFL